MKTILALLAVLSLPVILPAQQAPPVSRVARNRQQRLARLKDQIAFEQQAVKYDTMRLELLKARDADLGRRAPADALELRDVQDIVDADQLALNAMRELYEVLAQ